MSEPLEDRLANAGTLPEWLRAQAELRGSALALRHKQRGLWRTQSWRELEAQVVALASGLRARGFVAGDRLLLDIGPVPAAFLLTLAVSWLGGAVQVAGAEPTPAPLTPDGLAPDGLAPDGDGLAGGRGARFALVADDAARARLVAAASNGSPLALGIVFDADAGLLAAESDWIAYADLTAPRPDAAAAAGALAPTIAAQATTTTLLHWAEPRPLAAGGHDATRATRAPSTRTHDELAQNARDLILRGGIGRSESVLAGHALGLGQQLEHVLPSWLLAGFCLNFVEQATTEHVDRRELGPSVVFDSRRRYAELAEQVASNLPSRERVPGRWLHAGLTGRGGLSAIPRRLLTGRLREVLGLGRVRRAIALGPEALSGASFEGLFELALLDWPSARLRTPTERAAAPEADGDAALAGLSRGFDGPELRPASRSELA